MKIGQLMMRAMDRLGSIPGLSFLGGYVVSAKATHTRFGQRKGDYENYIRNIRRAGDDVREAVGGPGQEGDPDEVDDHDDGSVEHDYYDDYDDDSGYGEAGIDLVDDYPASDEYTAYFDDDYPSR